MATVQGVSSSISHGQFASVSVVVITCKIAAHPRTVVLDESFLVSLYWGLLYFQEAFQNPLHLYINRSIEDQGPQLGLLEPSPLSLLYKGLPPFM